MPRAKHPAVKQKAVRGRGSIRGNSSRGSAAREDEPYRGRFISQEREDKYNSDFKDRSIAKGKVVNLDFISSGNLFVGNRFRAMGWDRFISLSNPFYPALIKEFYANLEYHTHDSTLSSKVNNIVFAFSQDTLRGILHLPPRENTVNTLCGSVWPDVEYFVIQRDLSLLVCNKSLRLRDAPNYNSLNINSRIMQNLITYNILPHSGSKTLVTRYESFLMFCIHSSIFLDLSTLIFRHMISVTEKTHMSLPYPSLLTVIFQHFNIPLDNVEEHRYINHDILNGANLRKMHFMELPPNSGFWVHKSGEPDEHNGDWDPNPAPAPAPEPEPTPRSHVRQRTDYESVAPSQPEGSSSQSWEARLFQQNEAFHATYRADQEANVARITEMMGNFTTLSNSFQSFRTDATRRFDYIEEKMLTWDERFDEFYAQNEGHGDNDGNGDSDVSGDGGSGDTIVL